MLFILLSLLGGCLFFNDEIGVLIEKLDIKTKKKIAKKELKSFVMKRSGTIADKEIFASSIMLKNMAVVRKDTPLSGDYIIESLMKNSNLLKPIYMELLTNYRNGRDEVAFKIMAEEIGTKDGRNFATVLSKLDRINPNELVNQMAIFQSGMTEKNTTRVLKRAERNSIILNCISVASIFALFINFTVVVVFMNTMEMIENLFY